MQNQATNPDSGFEDHRVEFVRETAPGTVPADPAWNLYSDTLESALEWEGNAQVEARRGLGNRTPEQYFTGPEEHTLTISYDLQQSFLDGSGNPVDAVGDVIAGVKTGEFGTHTIVDRADKGDARTYVVARGCFPSLEAIEGDPGTSLPMTAEMAYEARKVRSYKVEQPSGETLSVSSTSADDTTQTLTIESDSASTTEEVTLDGTTSVSTTASFDSIDALWLDDDTKGDVIVEDGSGAIAQLYGSNSYEAGNGDRGIPTLGAGSHADPIGQEYERFLDDEIVSGGEQLAAEIRSASFSVEVDYDRSAVLGGTTHAIHVGNITTQFTATMAGDFEHHESLTQHLTGQSFSLEWRMTSNTLTFSGVVLSEAGTVGPAVGDVVSSIENTFSAKSVDAQ